MQGYGQRLLEIGRAGCVWARRPALRLWAAGEGNSPSRTFDLFFKTQSPYIWVAGNGYGDKRRSQ
jgi:hypothetical protein